MELKQASGLQGNEVLGNSILSILNGMEFSRSRALKILAENGITEIQGDVWYPLPKVLQAYHRVFEKVGPSTMRAVGRKIPENANLPPDIDTLEKALGSLDVAYRMNHRGPGDMGGYHYQPVAPRHVRLVCDSPYPCDVDLGILEAFGDKFRPKDSIRVRIEHDTRTCRLRGDGACTYDITW
jgi:hypothetical protein